MAKPEGETEARNQSNTVLSKVIIGLLIFMVLVLVLFLYLLHASLVTTQGALYTANQTISADNSQINNLNGQVSSLQSEYNKLQSQNTQLQNELAAQGIGVTPTQHQVTLFSQDYVFSIGGNAQYGSEYSEFSTPSTATGVSISGSYTSTGNVEVAILTPTQYGEFESNNANLATDNTYYFGDTTGGTINTPLSAGTYYIVFYSPSGVFGSTEDTVTIVNPIIAYYTS